MIVQMLEGRIDDGMVSGGQLTTTTDIENFPGFPEGIGGGELVDRMKAQCVRFGTKVLPETVSSVDFTKHREFIMHSTSGKTYKAEAVIIATGATAKKIPFKGSEEYWNKGISACAVCDGALPLFRNKPLVVIGGGDTAMEEAQFLTKVCDLRAMRHAEMTLRVPRSTALLYTYACVATCCVRAKSCRIVQRRIRRLSFTGTPS
jgi:thioredoxin reductase (NADPH)